MPDRSTPRYALAYVLEEITDGDKVGISEDTGLKMSKAAIKWFNATTEALLDSALFAEDIALGLIPCDVHGVDVGTNCNDLSRVCDTRVDHALDIVDVFKSRVTISHKKDGN